MAFPIAATKVPAGLASNPALSGTFIPEIWSGRLIQKFYHATVLAAVTNTFYEGEISAHGDKVIIRSIPTLLIRDYEADGGITVDRPSAPVTTLLIDKGLYFATVLDDVLRVQADMDLMNMWSEDAAQQLKIRIDTVVLASIPSTVDVKNKGATAGKISGDINLGVTGTPLAIGPEKATGVVGVMDLLIDLSIVLDEQNIPETNRWIIAPAWFVGMMLRSDIRAANIMGDSMSAFRNGRVGQVARFMVYQSNLLPTAVEGTAIATWILAGHANGVTFASQLTEMETLRVESTFGTIMRGLQVYGFKTIDPTCVATAYVKRAP